MSRHLYSLVPEFEGHWKYTEITKCGCKICNYNNINPHIQVLCEQMIAILDDDENQEENKIICPAWQVEDVLRNLHTILPVEKKIEIQWLPGGANPYAFVSEEICKLLRIKDQDTAYQKIEEYLWEILGHSRTEECTGAHCKCMQNDCANHHYNDHKK